MHQKIKLIISVGLLASVAFVARHSDLLSTNFFSAEPDEFSLSLPEIRIPERVCDIEDFGARSGDGQADTVALAAAINQCAEKGGGRVLVPEGSWDSGAIHLRSNVELHLEKNAEIFFSRNPADYLPVVFTRFEGMELYNYSAFIYAKDCQNIAITGSGKFHGQGESWSRWNDRQDAAAKRLYLMTIEETPVTERIFGTEDDALRPSMIQFMNCRNILITDVSVLDSPMWTIHPVYSENIRVKNVRINTTGHNTDGIVIDSSKNVVIDGAFLEAGDDAVSIKSGLDAEGRKIGRPSENIIIKNCDVRRGHSGVAIGSEMSGGVKDVVVWNNRFTNVDYGIRVKSLPGRGGYVENITAEKVKLNDIDTAVSLDMQYPAYTITPATADAPVFKNLKFADMQGSDIKNVIFVRGVSRELFSEVDFIGMDLSAKGGIIVENAADVEFDGLAVKAEEKKGKSERGPLFTLVNVGHGSIKNSQCPAEFVICLKLESTDPADITLENNSPPERWAVNLMDQGDAK